MSQEHTCSPEDALNDWLETAAIEKADETHSNYRALARRFQEFCTEQDITSMHEINGKVLLKFKVQRGQDIAQSSLRQNISCLRAFLRYCQQVEIVPAGTLDKVPDVTGSKEARDEKLEPERAEKILDYASRFEYASRRHATVALVWHTGLRTGAIRSLDTCDFHNSTTDKYIELVHRPDTGTRLKNGTDSEREVNISPDVADIIADYVEHERVTRTDEYGRAPLLTTSGANSIGRVSKAAIRRSMYSATRPCWYGEDCPVDKKPANCDAAHGLRLARECPDSLSGHPVRRGSITHALNEEVPKPVVSDRCDVSVDVLDKHYNRQTEEEKRKLREQYVNNL